MEKDETYQGGYDALLKRIEGRTAPLEYAKGEALPALDEDLTPLRTLEAIPVKPDNGSTFAVKRWRLMTEFERQPELLALHGVVIANLRKDSFPEHTPALFQKLWTEHGDFFLRRLPLRWLVSAVMTFGDHGVNEAQRQTGRSLSLLFSMMKLYEFERLYSGKPPQEPFSTDHKYGADLPIGIPAYSLRGGGLDAAVLGRIWKEAGDDAVVEPLAKHLLEAINKDPGTLFRRLQVMSGERKQTLEGKNNNPIPVPASHVKRNPRRISWGVVATINENIDKAVDFAAHHIDLGADQVMLFGEDPKALPNDLAAHPKIQIIEAGKGILTTDQEEQLAGRNARKAFYFNRARRKLTLDWLAMLDTDEFLCPDRAIRRILARVPEDAAFLTIPVVEKFAGSENVFRAPASEWNMSKDDKRHLYPNYDAYVPNLLLGPAEPRLFVRAKMPNIRVGNFVIKYKQRAASNGFTPDNLVVAHDHADSFASFLEHIPRRLDQGYARRSQGSLPIRSTLETIDMDGESTELEDFFNEIATARPEVLAALDSSGDLRRINLKLGEKVEKLLRELEA